MRAHVVLQPGVVGRVLVDDAVEVVDRHRELGRRCAQELGQHDDHEDAGAGEHGVLQADVVLEARHEQDRHERRADDADDDDTLVALGPDAGVDQAAAVVVHAEPQEQRCDAEVGEQPAGQGDPLQDPDDEAAHHDRKADGAAEHAALEDVVAAAAGHGRRHPDVGQGDGQLEQRGKQAGHPHRDARERLGRPHERPREDDAHGEEVVDERRPGRHDPGQPRGLARKDFGLGGRCFHLYPHVS